ncbi:MAG: ATP-grasp domain-containing protein [Chloroflexi bacterium]|nr:ATP-grasp domain-containing protein [Chloroflexota bacterium]
MKYHVAVTGLNATDDPNPGLGVIRSLREKEGWEGQLRVIGLAYDALDTGIHSPELVDEVYLLPYASQGTASLIHRLREIRQKTRIDVVIPTLDGEQLNFCQAAPILRTIGIRMLLPSESQIRLHFKHTLADFCLAHEIPTPRTLVIYESRQLEEAIGTLGYPLVLKGILHEAHMAYTYHQAQAYFEVLRARWGVPLVAQEHIAGDGGGVIALCDRKSKPVGMVAMKKLATTDKGKAWSGVTVKDEELLRLSTRILEDLKWVGPAELEFVRQAGSGKPYLLEINPRFPNWAYLAARAGQNLPAAAVQLALGKAVTCADGYQEGVIYVRHAQDIVCSMDQLAQIASRGELVLRKSGKRSMNGKGTASKSLL